MILRLTKFTQRRWRPLGCGYSFLSRDRPKAAVFEREVSQNSKQIYENTFVVLAGYNWMFHKNKELKALASFPNKKFFLLRSLSIISLLLGDGSMPVKFFFAKAFADELFGKDVQTSNFERLRKEFIIDIEKIEGEGCMSIENRRDFLVKELVESLMHFELSIYELVMVVSCLIHTNNINLDARWNRWLMDQLNDRQISDFATQIEQKKTRININKPRLLFALLEASCQMENIESNQITGFLNNLNLFLRSFQVPQTFGMISNCLQHIINSESRLSRHKRASDACRNLIKEVWLPCIFKEIDEAYDFSKEPTDARFLRNSFFSDFLIQGKSGKESNKFKSVLVGIPAYRRLVRAMNFCRIFREDYFSKIEKIFIFLTRPDLNKVLPEALQKETLRDAKENRKFAVSSLMSLLGRGNHGLRFVRTITDIDAEGKFIENIELANSALKCLVSHLNFREEGKPLTSEQLTLGEVPSWQWLDSFVTDLLFEMLNNTSDMQKIQPNLTEGFKRISFLTLKDLLCTVQALQIYLSDESKEDTQIKVATNLKLENIKGDRAVRREFYKMVSLLLIQRAESLYEVEKVNPIKLATIEKFQLKSTKLIEDTIDEQICTSQPSNLFHSDWYIERLNLHIELDGEVHRIFESDSGMLTWQTRIRNLLILSLGKKLVVINVNHTTPDSKVVDGIVEGVKRIKTNPELAFVTINLE